MNKQNCQLVAIADAEEFSAFECLKTEGYKIAELQQFYEEETTTFEENPDFDHWVDRAGFLARKL